MQLELKPYSACNVLVVDDEPISRILLLTILEPLFTCYAVSSGQEALDYCSTNSPDLVLLDMNMPDINGLTVCERLKACKDTQQIPVIFVTSTLDIEMENACWEVGASDFVTKPVNASTLIHRIKNHLQGKLRNELLEKMTFHDQLTGLYNRLYLTKEVPLEIKQVAREKSMVGIIMVDIDFFKPYNDTYGHLQGDICLKQVAEIIQSNAKRPKDAAIRFGGEEFMVVLPFTDYAGAKKVAEDIVKAVASAKIEHKNGNDGVLSVSAGFAVESATELDSQGFSNLIEKADNFLFAAKKAGRGRVVG